MKTINIGLFGFGCVGEGFYKIVTSQPDSPFHIRKIVIKDAEKQRNVPGELLTTDANEVFEDPEINLIVELINGNETAFTIVSEALRRKIPVVSANKKMLATHYGALRTLTEQHDTPLLYEGAVCGAIPILKTIDQYFRFDPISQIEGIFNGTTNYILTRQYDENSTFGDTLLDAQKLGYAELDASSDVDAFDPKYKLKLIMAHAFGLDVPVDDILNLGISAIKEQDLAYARNKGLKYRLLARLLRQGNQVSAFVAPALVSPEETAFNVNYANNYAELKTDHAEQHILIGKGAGSLPTGAAVFADVVQIATYEKGYQHQENSHYQFINDAVLEVIVSAKQAQPLNNIHFEEVFQEYASTGFYYKTGKILISELLALHPTELFIGLISEKVHFQQEEAILILA